MALSLATCDTFCEFLLLKLVTSNHGSTKVIKHHTGEQHGGAYRWRCIAARYFASYHSLRVSSEVSQAMGIHVHMTAAQ